MSYLNMQCIGDPEFINVTSISPLISKCEIKVLYVGENRNGSFIDKETATKMAETLPGTPIVGHYIEDKKDFGDHGEQLIIDDQGMRFNKLTKPYGFVSPTSRIWFQKFTETDMMGVTREREYLMTEGFLWTGQFEECKRVIEKGNGQSMELDDETLEGNWANNADSGMEFFIINDAIFSKLCILGEDVEPCFEGAEVTAPQVSSRFSQDSDFVRDLSTMMKELKNFMLQGGFQQMNEEQITVVDEATTSIVPEETQNEEFTASVQEDVATSEEAPVVENFSENLDNANESVASENDVPMNEEFAKKDEEEKEVSDDENEEEAEKPADDNKEDDKKKDEKYALLEESLEAQKAAYAELETKYQELVEFKNKIDTQKKEDLITSFCFLEEEDLADVKANIQNYSYDDIEAKLSVIAVRKKVNFSLGNTEGKEEGILDLDSLNNINDNDVPAWVKAVQAHENN